MNIDLRTGGPHSPEKTAEVADLVAEGIRYLNHATLGGAGGLEQPADIDRLISALATMASRLPQLFRQAEVNLDRIAEAPGVYDDRGHDAAQTVGSVSMGLRSASASADMLLESLHIAHQASAHLGCRDDGTEGSSGNG